MELEQQNIDTSVFSNTQLLQEKSVDTAATGWGAHPQHVHDGGDGLCGQLISVHAVCVRWHVVLHDHNFGFLPILGETLEDLLIVSVVNDPGRQQVLECCTNGRRVPASDKLVSPFGTMLLLGLLCSCALSGATIKCKSTAVSHRGFNCCTCLSAYWKQCILYCEQSTNNSVHAQHSH